MRTLGIPTLAGLLLASLTLAPAPADAEWPGRVLLTNDNGIEDSKLIELARAFADVAETIVVAATTDRSGTTNFMPRVIEREFRVEPRDLGDGIEAYALDGYPADCVVFALAGPLRQRPPDLVISGINGGPNLGDDWLGSGTIGAARTAAYLGIPALAVSGLDDGDSAAVRAAVAWIVELARSEAVRSLRAPQYLTVSLPRVSPTEIDGFAVTPRARGLISGKATRVEGDADSRQTWRLELAVEPERAAAGTDVVAAQQNRIAIVAMRADESDSALAELLKDHPDWLPAWSPPAASAGPENPCRSGLGVMIDDAEDAADHEWGVLIEEVLTGGRAEETGLQSGDVLVTANGVQLDEDHNHGADPTAVLQRVFAELDCGDTVELEYVRGEQRGQVRFVISDGKE